MRTPTRILGLAIAACLLHAAVAFAQSGAAPPATVGDLLALHYGVPNAVIVNKTVTCGTSATKLTVDDATRFADVFANGGTASCQLWHTSGVSSTIGYPLAVGGVITEDWRDDMTLPTNQMWCYCGAASTTISITELKIP